MALPPDRVRTFDRTGGTILHTSRTNPSKVKPEDVPDFVRQEDRDDAGPTARWTARATCCACSITSASRR